MRLLFIAGILFFAINVSAQSFSYRGIILDEKGNAISYATVALLQTTDSTLAFYAVTNNTGGFEIKNITVGKYILQASFLGYKTKYSGIIFPGESNESLKTIVMEPLPVNLPATEISAERIPLQIKGDTIEYNASSYKTNVDAVAEDLLKKLPGVTVDRNGNIKAQGEDVKKVMVDGKEFFGNDPKVATKNLPADAVSKVQVYDTKSDQAELTGINDGKRDKTINLQLKDDSKKAWFGEMQAGAGTENHFQTSAKAYRFTPEKQIAFLGMLNNINRFGFSFSDYMEFNGGLHGGGNSLNISTGNNSFPIDFGEVQKGLIISGAGGANYSSEVRKGNRINISYLANGMKEKLTEDNASTNFTGDETFYADRHSYSEEKNGAHRVNFGWKNKIDTMQTFALNGQAAYSNNSNNKSSVLANTIGNSLISDQQGLNDGTGNSFIGDMHSTYLKKLTSSWKLFSLELNGDYQRGLTHDEVNTLSRIFTPSTELFLNQFQKNNNDALKADLTASLTHSLGENSYLAAELSGGIENEKYSREQGLLPESDGLIDSLSATVRKNYQWIQPALKFKNIIDKKQLTLTVGAYVANMWNELDDSPRSGFDRVYILPSLMWENEYKTSHHLRLIYDASIVSPDARDLFPLTNYFDPLNQFSGNRNLKPEQHHDLRFVWTIFDQFSFSSFFAGLQFSYVKDKVNWSKSIDDNLVQRTTLVNVPNDYRAAASGEYSTPIRKLGVNINLNAEEIWNQSVNYIDGHLNRNTGFTHKAEVSFDNRKKNKWDASTGVKLTVNNSVYTLTGFTDNRFVRTDIFADVAFTPDDRWRFSVKADVSYYTGKAFSSNAKVPLLQAEASYSFLKHKKGALILNAFDLLNRNTGIERTVGNNYLMESRTDIIQRYVMLTFRYKLNKFSSGNKVDVKVN